MADVQKIITGNNQPNAGRGIVSIAGMAGLGASGTLMTEIASTNILNPPYNNPEDLDPPIAWLNIHVSGRFDDYNPINGGTP